MENNEESLRELWDTNICIIGVPEEGEREKEAENVFQEVIAKNFPNIALRPQNRKEKKD